MVSMLKDLLEGIIQIQTDATLYMQVLRYSFDPLLHRPPCLETGSIALLQIVKALQHVLFHSV